MKRIFVGETAHLPCGDANTLQSHVDWLHGKALYAKKHQIISEGKVINGGVGGRFVITGSTLIINNVTTDDNGVYTCVEDTRVGTQHRVVLNVQGNFRHCIFMLHILKCRSHCRHFRRKVPKPATSSAACRHKCSIYFDFSPEKACTACRVFSCVVYCHVTTLHRP